MKKRMLSILIIIMLMGAIVANHLITYARIAETPLYVKLTKADLNGIGYGNGNPTGGTSNQGEYIWNLMTEDTITGPASQKQKNLYCVRADYGQTWFIEEKEDEILEYNLTYDIQTDRKSLLEKLQDNGNDADDVIKNLLDPTGNQYRQLLWLFDNAYIKGQTKLDEYLTKIGIFSEEYEGETYYYKVDGEKEVYYTNGAPLTETDIIAIQRMAIWYFTNGGNYDKTDKNLWLFMTTDNGLNYDSLKNLSESRNEMAMDFYEYLISGAQNGANQYTAENGYKLDSAPASVDTSNLEIENDKYILNTQRVDSNYLIGPIVIEKNNDLSCDINIKVTDQDNKVLAKTTNYI